MIIQTLMKLVIHSSEDERVVGVGKSDPSLGITLYTILTIEFILIFYVSNNINKNERKSQTK